MSDEQKKQDVSKTKASENKPPAKQEATPPTAKKYEAPSGEWVPSLKLKKKYDLEGGFFTSFTELVTVGGKDVQKRGKISVSVEQMKKLAPVMARKHCFMHLFDISDSDRAKLLALPVNEVSRLYRNTWRNHFDKK